MAIRVPIFGSLSSTNAPPAQAVVRHDGCAQRGRWPVVKHSFSLMAAGRGFAMPGDVPSPERTLTHLTGFKQRAAKQYVAPMVFAFANAQLKRKEETLRYLEQSYQQRSPELVFVQNDPN